MGGERNVCPCYRDASGVEQHLFSCRNGLMPCGLPTVERQMEFQMHEVEPGWVEVRIVMPRQGHTESRSFVGEAAERNWMLFMLANAAGICHACDRHDLEAELVEMADI